MVFLTIKPIDPRFQGHSKLRLYTGRLFAGSTVVLESVVDFGLAIRKVCSTVKPEYEHYHGQELSDA